MGRSGVLRLLVVEECRVVGCRSDHLQTCFPHFDLALLRMPQSWRTFVCCFHPTVPSFHIFSIVAASNRSLHDSLLPLLSQQLLALRSSSFPPPSLLLPFCFLLLPSAV